jgi:hypothetical protein
VEKGFLELRSPPRVWYTVLRVEPKVAILIPYLNSTRSTQSMTSDGVPRGMPAALTRVYDNGRSTDRTAEVARAAGTLDTVTRRRRPT